MALMTLELAELVRDFASGLKAADLKRPVWTTAKGRSYQPGIGPHPEDAAVALVLSEMHLFAPERYAA